MTDGKVNDGKVNDGNGDSPHSHIIACGMATSQVGGSNVSRYLHLHVRLWLCNIFSIFYKLWYLLISLFLLTPIFKGKIHNFSLYHFINKY